MRHGTHQLRHNSSDSEGCVDGDLTCKFAFGDSFKFSCFKLRERGLMLIAKVCPFAYGLGRQEGLLVSYVLSIC